MAAARTDSERHATKRARCDEPDDGSSGSSASLRPRKRRAAGPSVGALNRHLSPHVFRYIPDAPPYPGSRAYGVAGRSEVEFPDVAAVGNEVYPASPTYDPPVSVGGWDDDDDDDDGGYNGDWHPPERACVETRAPPREAYIPRSPTPPRGSHRGEPFIPHTTTSNAIVLVSGRQVTVERHPQRGHGAATSSGTRWVAPRLLVPWEGGVSEAEALDVVATMRAVFPELGWSALARAPSVAAESPRRSVEVAAAALDAEFRATAVAVATLASPAEKPAAAAAATATTTTTTTTTTCVAVHSRCLWDACAAGGTLPPPPACIPGTAGEVVVAQLPAAFDGVRNGGSSVARGDVGAALRTTRARRKLAKRVARACKTKGGRRAAAHNVDLIAALYASELSGTLHAAHAAPVQSSVSRCAPHVASCAAKAAAARAASAFASSHATSVRGWRDPAAAAAVGACASILCGCHEDSASGGGWDTPLAAAESLDAAARTTGAAASMLFAAATLGKDPAATSMVRAAAAAAAKAAAKAKVAEGEGETGTKGGAGVLPLARATVWVARVALACNACGWGASAPMPVAGQGGTLEGAVPLATTWPQLLVEVHGLLALEGRGVAPPLPPAAQRLSWCCRLTLRMLGLRVARDPSATATSGGDVACILAGARPCCLVAGAGAARAACTRFAAACSARGWVEPSSPLAAVVEASVTPKEDAAASVGALFPVLGDAEPAAGGPEPGSWPPGSGWVPGWCDLLPPAVQGQRWGASDVGVALLKHALALPLAAAPVVVGKGATQACYELAECASHAPSGACVRSAAEKLRPLVAACAHERVGFRLVPAWEAPTATEKASPTVAEAAAFIARRRAEEGPVMVACVAGSAAAAAQAHTAWSGAAALGPRVWGHLRGTWVAVAVVVMPGVRAPGAGGALVV